MALELIESGKITRLDDECLNKLKPLEMILLCTEMPGQEKERRSFPAYVIRYDKTKEQLWYSRVHPWMIETLVFAMDSFGKYGRKSAFLIEEKMI